MIEKILVPIDGSEHSKHALEFACDLAQKFEAELFLLHISLTPSAKRTLVLGGAAITIEASRKEIEEAGRKVMEAAVKIAGTHGIENPKTEILGGPAAQRIIESAEKNAIDVIVMGSRGLSDLAGLLLGSVSHKVLQLAECTCITVR